MWTDRWKKRAVGGVSLDIPQDISYAIKGKTWKKEDDVKKEVEKQIPQSVVPNSDLSKFRKGRIGGNWKNIKEVQNSIGTIVVSIGGNLIHNSLIKGKEKIKQEHIIDVFRNDGLCIPYGERPTTEFLKKLKEYGKQKKQEVTKSQEETTKLQQNTNNSQKHYTAYFTHAFGGTWTPMKDPSSISRRKFHIYDPYK